MRLPGIFAVLSISFLITSPIFASDVMINEFSSQSDPEWVELYNASDQTVSLQGIVLFFDSSATTTQKVSFCDNDQMSVHGYKLIYRPSGSYWLSNNGDTLILKKEDDLLDTVSYGSGQTVRAPSATQSATRSPDGTGTWVLTNSPTPQGDVASFSCPTPVETQTPTPTPDPTNTPRPTPTRTPTPTKTPTPTLTPSPTETLLAEAEMSTEPAQVLSASTSQSIRTSSAFPYRRLAMSFALIGVGLGILSVVSIIKR